MLKLALATAALMFSLAASPVSAAEVGDLRWNMSLHAARVLYPQASMEAAGNGARTLALHDIDFAGRSWREVRLSFDARGRLEQAVVVNDQTSFEELRAQAMADMDGFSPVRIEATDGGEDAADVMICEDEFSRVSLTYVRPHLRSSLRYARASGRDATRG